MLNQILTILFGLAAVVAILTYFGIRPKGSLRAVVLSRNWKLAVMLLLVAASLGMSGYSLYLTVRGPQLSPTAWTEQLNHLKLIEGKSFGPDDRLILDGKNIQLCKFFGSTLVYRGTAPFLFANNDYDANGGQVKVRVMEGPQGTGARLVWEMLLDTCREHETSCDLAQFDIKEVNHF